MADRDVRPTAPTAHTWWSQRFLTAFEGLGLADALRGGRRLVRVEAVLDLRRSGNLVVARVRGPRDEEIHKARVAVRTLSGAQWARAERALAIRAGYAATLLAGSMPMEIDRIFTALGLSLFPTDVNDLAMDCTCDDWQRPCAHIAAACYQLARSLDRDPFELLALRGRERDAFLDGLRTHRPATEPSDGADGAHGADGADAHRFGPEAEVLELCGPLVVDPLGDLRELLRPAYDTFAAGSGIDIDHPTDGGSSG